MCVFAYVVLRWIGKTLCSPLETCLPFIQSLTECYLHIDLVREFPLASGGFIFPLTRTALSPPSSGGSSHDLGKKMTHNTDKLDLAIPSLITPTTLHLRGNVPVQK